MRWMKAAAAVVAIIALVGGVPYGLVRAVGNPWPPEGVNLMAPMTDGVIIGLLAAIVWLVWAQLMVCFALEVVAAVSSRGSEISMPGSSVQQQLARVLVGAVVAALASLPALGSASAIAAPSTNTTAVSTQTPAVSTPLAQTSSTSALVEQEEQATSTSTAAPESVLTVTVEHGDTLWSLAEQHLGDGTQWRTIADANDGKIMVDGSTFKSVDLLRPGWKLDIPNATTTKTPAGEHTVERGETLTGIALEELGDASAYTDIVDASEDIVQPGGARLVNPDHIEPGWTLQVGPTAADESVEQAPPEAESEEPAPVEAEPVAPVQPEADATPSPAAEPTAQPSAEPSSQAQPQEQAPVVDDVDEDAVPVRTLGGIGLLLATGIVSALAMRRRRQQRRREPGQAIALPSDDARRLEVELRSVADLSAPEAIDTLLRSLAHHFATVGDPLPAVKLARWHEQRLELYLTEETQLPAPWAPLEGRAAWTSPAQVPADVDVSLPAPYPTLVTIGHDEDNGMILANLELVGPVSVQASTTEEQQVLAAAALELGTMPWAVDVPVVLVGGWPELVDVLEPGRARYVPDLETYVPADELEILVLADEPDLDQAAMLTGNEAGVAVVGAGGTNEWRIEVDHDGHGLLAPIGLPFTPQLLTERDYQLLVESLQTAQTPTSGAETASPLPSIVPPAPAPVDEVQDVEEVHDAPVDVDEEPAGESELVTASAGAELAPDGMSPQVATAVLEREQAVDVEPADTVEEELVDEDSDVAAQLLQTGHPVLRLLGPKVELIGARGEEPTHVGVCLRMAVFLALHRTATKTQLVEAIWPATRVNSNTVNPRVSQLRKWLGVDGDDVAYLPPRSLALDERVLTDWDVFAGLVGADVTKAATDDLERALALVEARPLSGHAPNEFPFAEFAAQDMIAGVVDAAYELARRRYMDGRWRDVEKAAALGVLYEPGTERLWRIWMHAAHAAGNPPAVAEAIERVHARISELGFELEDETLQLIAALEAKDVGAIEQTREAL